MRRGTILGKSKAAGDLLGSRIVYMSSATTLSSLNLTTGVVDVNLTVTGLTTPYALDWDADYIYVAGTFSAAPHVRKINRTTLVQSNLASTTEPSGNNQRGLCNDSTNVYVAGAGSTRKYGKMAKSNNAYTSIATTGTTWYQISQNTNNVYLTGPGSATTGSIRGYNKSTNAVVNTLTAINCYGALADDNKVYIQTSDGIQIYDTSLTTNLGLYGSQYSINFNLTYFTTLVQDSNYLYCVDTNTTNISGINYATLYRIDKSTYNIDVFTLPYGASVSTNATIGFLGIHNGYLYIRTTAQGFMRMPLNTWGSNIEILNYPAISFSTYSKYILTT